MTDNILSTPTSSMASKLGSRIFDQYQSAHNPRLWFVFEIGCLAGKANFKYRLTSFINNILAYPLLVLLKLCCFYLTYHFYFYCNNFLMFRYSQAKIGKANKTCYIFECK